ncbi:unnamed protein product [Musa acuminata subsp. malaccensis]|uniref:(wild Malaysian banana) hypothetical protein n=1 Tax=Musa acuminata subsp. malaccensis TaxID=214687 RepID=A0A804HWG9_MUSAM|nr:unnamed protein product [Musa acuminata subsp. malaccensis]
MESDNGVEPEFVKGTLEKDSVDDGLGSNIENEVSDNCVDAIQANDGPPEKPVGEAIDSSGIMEFGLGDTLMSRNQDLMEAFHAPSSQEIINWPRGAAVSGMLMELEMVLLYMQEETLFLGLISDQRSMLRNTRSFS